MQYSIYILHVECILIYVNIIHIKYTLIYILCIKITIYMLFLGLGIELRSFSVKLVFCAELPPQTWYKISIQW